MKKYNYSTMGGQTVGTAFIDPTTYKQLRYLNKYKLTRMLNELNKSALKLHREYNALLKFQKDREGLTVVSEQNLREFIIAVLTPSNGPNEGCTSFEYNVRKQYYKQDNTPCPYIYCRYWFDNEEWGNCINFVVSVAKEDGEKGAEWSLGKIGGVNNLITRGILSRERVRQLEKEGIQHLVEKCKLKGMPVNPVNFIEKFLDSRGGINGLCTEDGTGAD